MPLRPESLSPAGWLAHLETKLDAQALAVRQPIDYYDGMQRLAFATAKFKEAFSRYFPPIADNWMQLVVNAPVERLEVQGFRFSTTADDPATPEWEQEADEDAWALWQANAMDSVSIQAFTEAVKTGIAYLLVTPRPNEDHPLITAELADQCYVEKSVEDPRQRVAAIKRWIDEDGYAYAYVYLPTTINRWRSQEPVTQGQGKVQWTRAPNLDPVDNNPLGVVPLVPLENRPDLRWGGRSDLEPAIPIQDAVNKLCLDMLVSSEFHAYPQRWASGWEGAVDAQGNEIENLDLVLGQSRLVRAENPESKFGQWEPGEVSNYIRPVEMYLDHLAAVTQTPAYYLKGQMANLSAEALRAADSGLIQRVRRKHLSFSDGLEETMRVAFLAQNDTKRAEAESAETIWVDPEPRPVGALVDAAVKMRESLSAPLEMCWQMIGWSPQQIRQARSMMNLPESPAVAAENRPPGELSPSAAAAQAATMPKVVLPAGTQAPPPRTRPAARERA